MRALSLWQPWATLIAIGAKRIETRAKRIHHRGEIAIHAAMTWNQQLDDVLALPEFAEALAPLNLTRVIIPPFTARPSLPFGAIVALVDIVDVRPTVDCMDISDRERAFGDYRPGRFAIALDRVRPLTCPVRLRGYQGTWFLTDEQESKVREQVTQ